LGSLQERAAALRRGWPRGVAGVSPGRLALAGLFSAITLVLVSAAIADRLYAGRIADGVRVGGVDVGGLDRTAARARLERRLVPRLRGPIVVRATRGRVRLTARAARVVPDIGAMVAAALERSRRGWFLPRAFRALTGGSLVGRLPPQVSYSSHAVTGFIHRARAVLDHRPRDAHLRFSAQRLRRLPGRQGFALDAPALRRQLEASLAGRRRSRTILARGRQPAPAVTLSELPRRYPTVITIDREHYRLRFFRHLHPVKSYVIAVGMAGLHTPAGLYHVHTKLVNPPWHVPNSPWAGSLAGQVIPPGPDDPLKARWIGLVDGVGIHGTDETWSLGHNASHGCIRMSIPAVIKLYKRVRIGTPVYIA
jgi:hypothetical protein